MQASALYVCTVCREERTYGFDNATPGYDPLLNCCRCKKPTRHRHTKGEDRDVKG